MPVMSTPSGPASAGEVFSLIRDGLVLTRSDVRVPRYATTNLAGRTVTEVAARGKHLLIRVEGGVTVHTHLRMDGSWRVRPARERIANSHRIRLLLANDTWQAVGYQLGIVEVLLETSSGQSTFEGSGIVAKGTTVFSSEINPVCAL